jgi:hypothetical protein
MTRKSIAAVAIAAGTLFSFAAPAATDYGAVTHATGTVDGFKADIWRWYDSNRKPRTAALKKEGNGNSGHGGYAVQMTYWAKIVSGPETSWRHVVVNLETDATVDPDHDGGFGYFVSHERDRLFVDKSIATIAGKIFATDDSPLGLDFAATASIPPTRAGVGIERFTIAYGHYGTVVPHKVNPNTGLEFTPLPLTKASYQFYTIPVTTSWVFQAGMDYPRIDIALDLSRIVPPGSKAAKADLVSFDLRGPYGVMVFDDGADGVVDTAMWGDQAYLFTTQDVPATRASAWDWSAANNGARYNALIAGGYEMGLYEPRTASRSATVDGDANERGYTNVTYAAAGGTSDDSCSPQGPQTLPSDGTWPYQSLQYSLPCPASDPNYLTDPAYGKKIAWGSTAFFGTSLTSVWNGRRSYNFTGWPADHKLVYSVCLVLGWQTDGLPLTSAAAAAYTAAQPVPSTPDCATAAPPS